MVALLGLIAPLVLLYVLKIQRERRRVSSIWLWRSAERDLLARQPFRRLVPYVSLVLEALALVCLALAFARPSTRGGQIDDREPAVTEEHAVTSVYTPIVRAAVAQEVQCCLERGTVPLDLRSRVSQDPAHIRPSPCERRRPAASTLVRRSRNVPWHSTSRGGEPDRAAPPRPATGGR